MGAIARVLPLCVLDRIDAQCVCACLVLVTLQGFCEREQEKGNVKCGKVTKYPNVCTVFLKLCPAFL